MLWRREESRKECVEPYHLAVGRVHRRALQLLTSFRNRAGRGTGACVAARPNTAQAVRASGSQEAHARRQLRSYSLGRCPTAARFDNRLREHRQAHHGALRCPPRHRAVPAAWPQSNAVLRRHECGRLCSQPMQVEEPPSERPDRYLRRAPRIAVVRISARITPPALRGSFSGAEVPRRDCRVGTHSAGVVSREFPGIVPAPQSRNADVQQDRGFLDRQKVGEMGFLGIATEAYATLITRATTLTRTTHPWSRAGANCSNGIKLRFCAFPEHHCRCLRLHREHGHDSRDFSGIPLSFPLPVSTTHPHSSNSLTGKAPGIAARSPFPCRADQNEPAAFAFACSAGNLDRTRLESAYR